MLLLQKPGSSSTTTRVLKGFFGQAVAACILYKRARKQGHKKAIPCRTKQGHLSSIVLEPYFPLDIEPLDYRQYYQMPPTLIGKAFVPWKQQKAIRQQALKNTKCITAQLQFGRCSLLQTPPPSLLFSMLSSFSVLYIVGLASATCQLCTILEIFLQKNGFLRKTFVMGERSEKYLNFRLKNENSFVIFEMF